MAANPNDLMVISKGAWTIPWPVGCVEGYPGVNVHFESDRPGAFVLHCELHPRQGSEAKAAPQRIAELLKVKGEIALALREQIASYRMERFASFFF